MSSFGPVINIEYLNRNALIAFPLADDVTELDVNQDFKIPRGLMVDLVMPIDVDLDVDLAAFHIYQIGVFGGGVVISIAYTSGSDDPVVVGQVNVIASSHTLNASYFIHGIGDFDGSVGRLTIGRLDDVIKQGGLWTFDKTGARLLPAAFPPDLRQISALRIRNGAEVSEIFDDVELISGQNTRWVVEEDEDGNKKLRLDALKRDDLNDECGCDNENDLPPPIRTINNTPPRPDGSFEFIGDKCIEFTAGSTIGEAGVLFVKDKCSDPCCGVTELDVIKDDLNNLNLDIRTLSGAIVQMEAGLIAMNDAKVAIEATGVLGDNPSP